MTALPKIYGYIRVSTEQQADSGLSLAAQSHQIVTHQAALIARHPHLSRGRIYRDPAVSGSKTVLRRRPQGSQLWRALKAEDHVIFAKLDRGFRSTKDCLYTLEEFSRRGVVVHLLDLAVDTSTPAGKLLITILAAMAEWEAARFGERIRDAHRARRRSAPGRAVSAVRVLGYAIDENHMLTPHREERAAGKLASDLRRDGRTWAEVMQALQDRHYVRPPQPYGPKRHRTPPELTRRYVQILVSRHRAGYPLYPGCEPEAGGIH